VQHLAHPWSSDGVSSLQMQEIQPHINRIRKAGPRGFAFEPEMLDTWHAAFDERVPTSCGQRRPGDAILKMRARTEPMHQRRTAHFQHSYAVNTRSLKLVPRRFHIETRYTNSKSTRCMHAPYTPPHCHGSTKSSVYQHFKQV
jgi:hypothetical protein